MIQPLIQMISSSLKKCKVNAGKSELDTDFISFVKGYDHKTETSEK